MALLDSIGREHPIGHQGSKANRYLVQLNHGGEAEVMFEKNPEAPPNLWLAADRVAGLIGGPIPQQLSSACKLYGGSGKGGVRAYGRHSALRPMPELGDADLVCFTPRNLQDVGLLLDTLLKER